MRRYLGMMCGRYGDLYMATVAARALKAADPSAHLTFTVGADYADAAPLFINQPHIDSIRVLHSRGADGHDEVDRAWIAEQRFDHVFDPRADHDHSRPWFLYRNQPHETCFMHGLPIPDGDTGKINMVKWFKHTPGLDRTVAFAPFPAWYAGLNNDKALTIERAQAVADYLMYRKGYRVLQVGAPDEPVLQNVEAPATGYFESVRNILGCRAFIGGDSGMMWLMSGYDHPCLGFYGHRYYGAANVGAIQPINPNALYLDAAAVNDIDLETQVFPAIDAILS